MSDEIDDLRREIVETAGKIRAAYGHKDWPSFHLNLGMMYGLTARLYEANAKAETEWDPDTSPSDDYYEEAEF